MTVTQWWLGVGADDNSATVNCRSNANATVTITVNGRNFTAIADTSVKDGIVSIPISGLTSTRAPYYIDGVLGGTVRSVNPTNLVVGTGSCWNVTRVDTLAYKMLADYDPDVYFIQGDFPYCNQGSALYGENTSDVTTSLANNQNSALYLAQHRQARMMPGMKELMRSVRIVYMPDDHEYTYDNYCPGSDALSLWQAGVSGAAGQAYSQMQISTAAAKVATDAYTIGNPVNNDAGIDSGAYYTRFTLGPCEFFIVDCMNYRSAYTATDNSSKTMLGANQKAWLTSKMLASTATWKFLVTGKQLWRIGGNTDTWATTGGPGYQNELNSILNTIKDVTGVLAVCGDAHRIGDMYCPPNTIAGGNPALTCLEACPAAVNLDTSSYSGYDTNIIYRQNGALTGAPAINETVNGLFRISSSRVDRYLLTSLRDLVPRGYLDSGSGVLKYQNTKLRF